jgi:hypothetical protein
VKHIVELIVIFVTVLVCGAVAEAGQAKVYRWESSTRADHTKR